ncbi:MAG TPA: hypothetical protein VMT03_27220 [Polyangia bacterium]|nr:hypothetical protein [Polyangia bacterium]
MRRIRAQIFVYVAAAGCATFGAGLAARAETSSEVHTSNGSARVTRETATVAAIDKKDRVVMLQNEQGETTAVDVPPDLKMFDKLKVGDRVDVDYYQGLAVSMLPPGSTPTRTERESRSTAGAGGASVGREITASAEILSVDAARNMVTFKGQRGIRTVHVEDPRLQQMLATLKPGQVVQLTYKQAMAASIRPAAK